MTADISFADELEKIALAPGAARLAEALSGAIPGGAAGLLYVRAARRGKTPGEEEVAGLFTGATLGAGAALGVSAAVRRQMFDKAVKTFMATKKTLAGADKVIQDAPVSARGPLIQAQIDAIDTHGGDKKLFDKAVRELGLSPSRMEARLKHLPKKVQEYHADIAAAERKVSDIKTDIGHSDVRLRALEDELRNIWSAHQLQGSTLTDAEKLDAFRVGQKVRSEKVVGRNLRRKKDAVVDFIRDRSALGRRMDSLLRQAQTASGRAEGAVKRETKRLRGIKKDHDAMVATARQDIRKRVGEKYFGVFG